MSYSHETVARIIAQSKNFGARLAMHIQTANQEDVKPVIHDGIPYDTRTYELFLALKKVNPYLEIGYAPGCITSDRLHVASAWVYVPTQQYALMKIGYGPFRANKNLSLQYMICARHIKNEKYKEWRDQYLMLHSDSLPAIVAKAKKYLRPYTPQEEAALTYDKFKANTYSEKVASDVSLIRAADNIAITLRHTVISELVAMRQAGHVFAARQLCEAVDAYIEQDKATKEEASLHAHAWYVRIVDRFGQAFAEVLPVFDVQSKWEGDIAALTTVIERYKLDEIPEPLAGRLTVLGMMSAGEGVSGVGCKITDAAYWVERRADE